MFLVFSNQIFAVFMSINFISDQNFEFLRSKLVKFLIISTSDQTFSFFMSKNVISDQNFGFCRSKLVKFFQFYVKKFHFRSKFWFFNVKIIQNLCFLVFQMNFFQFRCQNMSFQIKILIF